MVYIIYSFMFLFLILQNCRAVSLCLYEHREKSILSFVCTHVCMYVLYTLYKIVNNKRVKPTFTYEGKTKYFELRT
jgi:hypothetical protein